MNSIFFHSVGMSSFQLTKSYICSEGFGKAQPPTSWTRPASAARAPARAGEVFPRAARAATEAGSLGEAGEIRALGSQGSSGSPWNFGDGHGYAGLNDNQLICSILIYIYIYCIYNIVIITCVLNDL